MEQSLSTEAAIWPIWKKIIFRFFFVYLALQIAPWLWLDFLNFITRFYGKFIDWLVDVANSHLFHVRKVLVPQNGSGDTSYGWAELWLYLLIAAIACIIWSVADRKRINYVRLNYWLCLFVRYYIAMVALRYGIIKLFDYQMPFPNLHQLATPLGDFLPMRLSWMFIGYSTPYQTFSGIMEITAALLLLFRRTATLGALFATAVFVNVMMLNLCYDIPVKIFSMQLVFTCLFLLANESNRIICFFLMDKPAPACSIYHIQFTKKWMRITRIVLKLAFIFLFLVAPLSDDAVNIVFGPAKHLPVLREGVYDVTEYRVNKQAIPPLTTDTMRWQDFIITKDNGSIKTRDTSFIQRYNRAYFVYKVDTLKHTLTFTKRDTVVILSMNYFLPDTNTIRLSGKRGNDSLFVELKRTKRHFQLTERQFHWLSEHNR